MRRQPLLWLTISIVCFVAAFYFWRLGDKWAREKAAPTTPPTNTASQTVVRPQPFPLLKTAPLDKAAAQAAAVTNRQARLAYRLSNTDAKITELTRTPEAILLENALIDTRKPMNLSFPAHLQALEEPGAWIVQAKGPATPAFRNAVTAAGASIVAYIPNNAYLVTGSKRTAEALRGAAGTQSVLAYEPYYKLKSSLLRTAAQMRELPKNAQLNVLLFPGAGAETLQAIGAAGSELVSQTRSPFGDVVTVKPEPMSLPALARLPGVQVIELARERVPANDLSRVLIGLSTNSITTENYLGLTGSNVVVGVVDTGIDANHPDLTGRVFSDLPIGLVDTNGHGTHVAGIIGSTGGESETVTGAIGSIMPGVEGQFRGKAPGSELFSMIYTMPDLYLQETAAATNALVSNNSWEFRGAFEYDLAAASYDAAVRDSLPQVTGSQSLAYVFAAGNHGAGSLDGISGNPETVVSPGTAKNVITVGASEMFRNITNEAFECFPGELEPLCLTNATWLGETDSEDEVPGFSSRGNVGISIEGEKGRFKPDLVAPGAMVISTRSGQWDEESYYAKTNISSSTFTVTIFPGEMWVDAFSVGGNVLELSIATSPNEESPQPFPDVPIYLSTTGVPTNTAGGYEFQGENEVVLPRDFPLNIGGRLWYGIQNPTTNFFPLNITLTLTTTNGGNAEEILRSMNDALGQYYRYESGSSMAAAQVSGTVALMHEFFMKRGETNSPALMKALLINGARNLNPEIYDLSPKTDLNSQGWGLINITNSLQASIAGGEDVTKKASLIYFDQSPTNALVSGAQHTYPITVDAFADYEPIRVTLVWTDPPGNPVASVKLVNNLDIVVTNLDTGAVYFGNDIGAGAEFTEAWDTNSSPVPNWDVVNNVENIFLPPFSGSNFTVTVIGKAVNVNAVTAHPNDVAQDYALVISCGNGAETNALTLGTIANVALTVPNVTVMTNMFQGSQDYTGGVLSGQHAGASTPLLGTNTIAAPAGGLITLGMTNQWHFYVITNEMAFTNAAFMTFIPPELAVPRMGATQFDVDNATREEADIDMYVSTEAGLTNLDPAVIERSTKSLGRLGSETIILSNAVSGVYYIGVKAEDQQAAEYVFAGVFSRFPFSQEDALGNQTVLGFPVPQDIPDAYLNAANRIIPGQARILGFSVGPDLVRRVIVTNVVSHELFGDLTGVLSHGTESATLNNHTTNTPVFNQMFVYDDSGEGDIPGANASDGPGTLMNFGGRDGAGQWIFTQSDGAVTHRGTNGFFSLWLEKQPDLEKGIIARLRPGACRTDYVRVPAEATNLTIEVTLLDGSGPIGLQVCPLDNPVGCKSTTITNGLGGSVTIDILDTPPIGQGVYSVRTCNLGTDEITVRILARIYRGSIIRETLTTTTGSVPVKDDAVTYAYLTNLTDMRISATDVGLVFNHPRISDLAITLISPNGTRILLFEDRGGTTTNGMGQITSVTNASGEVAYFSTRMAPFFKTSFDSATPVTYAPGALIEGWNVLTNRALVVQDWSERWRSNNVLVPNGATVQFDLPTTNATDYNLTWLARHAPYIVGTVGWWPFEGDGRDIFGGLDGQLLGGGNTTNYSMWSTGKVYNAFYGNAVRTSVRIPYAPELDVAATGGFTVEGWIKPVPRTTNTVEVDAVPLSESFESFPAGTLNAGTYANGWGVFSGSVTVYPNTTATNVSAADGAQFISLGGVLSTNITLVANEPYRITLSYARSPETVVPAVLPQARVNIGGIPMVDLSPVTVDPAWTAPQWQSTSFVFTASSPLTTIELQSITAGVLVDALVIEAEGPAPDTAPLVEWVGTNGLPGVQFWVSGLTWTNPVPGSLIAAFGTNSTQVVVTDTNAAKSLRWQHVALSYDPVTSQARIYSNGRLAASGTVPADAAPITAGDLYFGFHPGNITNIAAFRGGLDEFGLYNRPLTDCEVEAIFLAGSNGKYSTNALTCPVAYELTLETSTGTTVLTYTNGVAWTNGPFPEINSLSFTNPILSAVPGGLGTNLTSITIRPLTANLALDEFILSGLVSNRLSGSLQFTENTNLALVPIKFAPTPYNVVSFPPALIYSNTFFNAAAGIYTNGQVLPGLVAGVSDWSVGTGTVSVISNRTFNPLNTNSLVLGESTVQTVLPTVAGKRYELTYSVRGPGAVSWWNGNLEPLSGRAIDLLGGNHGAFLNGATNNEGGFVLQPGPDTALTFPVGQYNATNPYPVVARSPRIELGDPDNLKLTNALTIEGWIYPRNMQTNFALGVGTRMQQIFFRGDARDCLDPYYLAVYYNESASRYDLVFHVEDATGNNCGVDLFSTNSPVVPDEWQHVAAVFESGVLTPAGTKTNQLSVYLEGELVGRRYTAIAPFADLDPSFSPGAAIGNRSRYSVLTPDSTDAQPFFGDIDDLAVYGRALSTEDIRAISQRGVLGKGDPAAAPTYALSAVAVSVDNLQIDQANGDNGQFASRTVTFNALSTNSVLTFRGLLPGTIIDKVSLTEIPSEMNYLPEEKLSALIGENAYGVWTLEIVDTRAGGGSTNDIQLVEWRLDLQMTPTYEVPVITLSHGISYQNTLLPGGVQHFVVPVPQWASYATNILVWATNRVTGQPGEVGVLYDPAKPAPLSITNALFWPAVFSGSTTLTTNSSNAQFIVPGQNYYLTVTNPAPVPVSFEFGVLYDIPTLTNCVPHTNMANIAGIAKYFQFDVPPQAPDRAPRQAMVSLDGYGSNLTLVVSQTLPLPDLGNYDYISRRPSTNGQMVMVLTNTTPYPLQQGRWYAGVYSSQYTNVPFTIQVCYSDYTSSSSNTLQIIPLTNNLPFVASFDGPFAAPPGPPEWMFYEFDLTNSASAMLFEMYNLTGNADLILQRHVPSGMAPYFDGSFKPGTAPESITVRMGRELADLRGKWYLGVYNNESTNVGYTIRATVPDSTGLLNTALPLVLTLNAAAGTNGVVLQWNSIPGEVYIVEFSPSAFPLTWQPFPMAQPIIATTTMSAVELPIGTSSRGFYRVRHVPRDSVLVPPASVQIMPDGRIRLSWPLAYGNVSVLYSTSLTGGGWQNANLPITIEGGEYVAYDDPQGQSRYYRLMAL